MSTVFENMKDIKLNLENTPISEITLPYDMKLTLVLGLKSIQG